MGNSGNHANCPACQRSSERYSIGEVRISPTSELDGNIYRLEEINPLRDTVGVRRIGVLSNPGLDTTDMWDSDCLHYWLFSQWEQCELPENYWSNRCCLWETKIGALKFRRYGYVMGCYRNDNGELISDVQASNARFPLSVWRLQPTDVECIDIVSADQAAIYNNEAAFRKSRGLRPVDG